MKKSGRAESQRKTDRLDQAQQMDDLGMSFARRRQEEPHLTNLGVGLDNIILQPSPHHPRQEGVECPRRAEGDRERARGGKGQFVK